MLTEIITLIKDNKIIFRTILYSTSLTLGAIFISRYFKSRAWSKLAKSIFYQPMEGKVCLVTGANCGIGYETVRELVKLKAAVIMGCRDLKKGQDAILKIKTEYKDAEVFLQELDLASFESICAFAKNVLKEYPKIHVLVNNAGVSIPVTQNQKTKDGFEVNFGVNYLGHFLLTQLLQDRVIDSGTETDHSKIVVVASSLLDRGVIDFDNLNGEKGFIKKGHMNPAYSNSKLMNYYFASSLFQKLEGKDVDVCAVCPGWCYTELFRYADIKWYQKAMVFPIALMYMRSANQGAQSVVHCIIQKDQSKHYPPIFRDFVPYTTKHKIDESISKKLWEVSEKLIGNK